MDASSIPFNCSIQPRTQHPAPSADRVNPMQHSRFSVVLVIPAPFPFESLGSQRRNDGIQRLLRTSVFPHHTGGFQRAISVQCWRFSTLLMHSNAALLCSIKVPAQHLWITPVGALGKMGDRVSHGATPVWPAHYRSLGETPILQANQLSAPGQESIIGPKTLSTLRGASIIRPNQLSAFAWDPIITR